LWCVGPIARAWQPPFSTRLTAASRKKVGTPREDWQLTAAVDMGFLPVAWHRCDDDRNKPAGIARPRW